jgi:PAS domain S-box-containing protein
MAPIDSESGNDGGRTCGDWCGAGASWTVFGGAAAAATLQHTAGLRWARFAVHLGLACADSQYVTRHAVRERTRIQAALHASEARYRFMFEENTAVQLVADLETGTLVDVNAAALAFYGYTRETMLSMNSRELSGLSAEERLRRLEGVRRMNHHTFEQRHVLASGEVRDVEVHLSLSERADRRLIYTIVHDITERKLAEEALRASEERFRKQYRGFPLPTFSWLEVGDDFALQDFNDAAEKMTEGQIGDLLGSPASAMYVQTPQILCDLQACVTGQQTLTRELRYRYRTGAERDLVLTYVFVPPQTVMLHTEDVTEARHAEQQGKALIQSEKLRALGQMAIGIAHDLNQSLMLVASYSDLASQALVQDPQNLAEIQDLLTTTTQAAIDGGETVKRLLRFTRAVPEQHTEWVDLSTTVREAARLTAPRWRDEAQVKGRPINLHVEAEGNPIIQGSQARLRELMTNLIFNAVEALPSGGTIHLRVVAQAGQGIIEVTDSGLGMSAEVQARVFEPFFTTKGESGTGLGLAMVFGIVEQHGGHINVRSAPGDGTTFRITFPLMGPSQAEPSIVPTQLERSRPLRVLTVDDEPMMTKAVVRMLRPSGHMVVVAASGEEAIEKLVEQPFDVVVSDMGMGLGMNGLDLAEAVKHRWPDVRFLLATGWGAAIDPVEARARGVEAVLSKPYHPLDLVRALASPEAAA